MNNVPVSAGGTVSITVGAGGTGGNNANNANGGDGGDSSYSYGSSNGSVNGGEGGTGGASSGFRSGGAGGAAGSGTNSFVSYAGGLGGTGGKDHTTLAEATGQYSIPGGGGGAGGYAGAGGRGAEGYPGDGYCNGIVYSPFTHRPKASQYTACGLGTGGAAGGGTGQTGIHAGQGGGGTGLRGQTTSPHTFKSNNSGGLAWEASSGGNLYDYIPFHPWGWVNWGSGAYNPFAFKGYSSGHGAGSAGANGGGGGGSCGHGIYGSTPTLSGAGGAGGVRIIWGDGRAYPSTDVADW